MSKTYQTTGINLKASPMGESDRLVTILTPDLGLMRVIAPGARKPKSSLGGRSDLFVVNQLLIARGKSLDRITQAETVRTYRHLSTNLTKLSTSQYWAEIVLSQALSEQPQPELYDLLNAHLNRLDNLQFPDDQILAHLCQGIFHLLAAGGIAPQVHNCCLTRQALVADISALQRQAVFNVNVGGAIHPTAIVDKAMSGLYDLTGLELGLFQQLSAPDLADLTSLGVPAATGQPAWIKIERILRQYIRHHLGSSIRSATLLLSEN